MKIPVTIKFYSASFQIDEDHVKYTFMSYGNVLKTFKEVNEEAKEEFYVRISTGERNIEYVSLLKKRLEENGYHELEYDGGRNCFKITTKKYKKLLFSTS